jgi:hypothetical protein
MVLIKLEAETLAFLISPGIEPILTIRLHQCRF